MNNKAHWEHIYTTKTPTQVSWYQPHAQLSLQIIKRASIQPADPIIDVGGGASLLVEDLLDAGFQNVTVLDISAAALDLARQRLGERAAAVNWQEADITQVDLPSQAYVVWHDRAVFHFLTQAADRQRYVQQVRQAVKPAGQVIIATFALDGPEMCSDLNVMRYSPASLQLELGDDFELVADLRESHHTPFNTQQNFIYCHFRKRR